MRPRIGSVAIIDERALKLSFDLPNEQNEIFGIGNDQKQLIIRQEPANALAEEGSPT
ncbi:MAG: hypothetical protein IJD43_13750 [Thermoguttaceae bacterium]|nr:hypothetical protein [Thermoguttaceae bacterium]